MTASFLRRTLAATACTLALATGPMAVRLAAAQQPMQQSATEQAQPTPAQQAAIARDMKTVAEYRLPKDFFTRMMPVIEQIRQSRISPPETPNMSLEETIKRTADMEALKPILQHSGMSAREFVMGITTFGLTSAVMQHPAQDSKNMPPLNPDNVKLLQSHQAQTQALIQAMGGSEGEGQQSGAPQ
ncbi:hypothetical protein [Komagataeibacter xylinus]|uniref:DUF4168 domain-containing protein n=1 Tax=Komagataeibacter xylinus TaxID=28448 RepID=A0A857FKF4_KOMXY|nr:hypothetical protein [Komagataeibacter xylinus]QHC34661.1 hypothetical protein FMA36_03290 [Komagataeibacter xylinus]